MKNNTLYGIALLSALIVNVIIVYKNSKKKKLKQEEILNLLLYENMGIIFGGKCYTYITNYAEYKYSSFFNIGLSSYGALIGASIMIIIYIIQFEKEPIKILEIIFLPLPLMYAIGKLGCFTLGCCRGIKYRGLGAVAYKIDRLNNIELYFPIQIIESCAFIIIFIYLLYLLKKQKYNFKNILKITVISNFTKFFHNQIVSICIAIFSLLFLKYNKKQTT